MKRELSCFFAREMIPLLELRRLDQSRREQLEGHLADCPACRAHRGRVSRGLEIAGELKSMEPSESLIRFVDSHHSRASGLARWLSWPEWSPGARWTAELAAVAAIAVVVIELVPWARLVRGVNPSPPPPAQDPLLATDGPTEPLPEEGTEKAIPETDLPPSEPGPEPRAQGQAAPTPAPESRPGAVSGATASRLAAPAEKGVLYTGEMTVNAPLPEPDTIRLTIESLGGQKAGQVRLGWKQQTGRYYHFSLPENNYETLLNQLKAIGNLRIRRQSHPRVMPAGIIRVILTVEEPSERDEDGEQTGNASSPRQNSDER